MASRTSPVESANCLCFNLRKAARAITQTYDAALAMYHDQGHIALKLVGFETAVNITLGLPILRTSPSHGTAFDIAWQGLANGRGLQAAIETAKQLHCNRTEDACL